MCLHHDPSSLGASETRAKTLGSAAECDRKSGDKRVIDMVSSPNFENLTIAERPIYFQQGHSNTIMNMETKIHIKSFRQRKACLGEEN